MRTIYFSKYGGELTVKYVPTPTAPANGVVIEVKATGLCRSDWHAWMGHDTDVALPHVPGHELAGVVSALGSGVTKFAVGDRVTIPFVNGCGEVGQSTIMIAKALGARVIAVDILPVALANATQIGAESTINSSIADRLPPIRVILQYKQVRVRILRWNCLLRHVRL